MTTGYGLETFWFILIVAGLGTLALRLSFILLLGRLDELPPTVGGVLRFVPAAVLAALVVPAIISLSIHPSAAFVFETEKLIAGSVAALAAWYTRDVLATIGVGMLSLWALQLVV